MKKQQLGSKDLLINRSYCFSLSIIRLIQKLKADLINNIICKQLLRSSTSIGANITEAQAGRTKRDFTNYYHIALKSANESTYWLRIMLETERNPSKVHEIKPILKELEEISKMLNALIKSLKSRLK